jgi:hypothetical protein
MHTSGALECSIALPSGRETPDQEKAQALPGSKANGYRRGRWITHHVE